MSDPNRIDTGSGPLPGGTLTGRGLFWRAQIIGWFLFGVVYFLALLPRSPAPASLLFGFKMVWAATGTVVTTALWGVYRITGLLRHRLGAIAAGSVGCRPAPPSRIRVWDLEAGAYRVLAGSENSRSDMVVQHRRRSGILRQL